MSLNWRVDRTEIGRRRDEPGDGFIYLVHMTPQVEDRFEWLEVTEVFTTVPASRIEGAMRAWNGIPDNSPVDFDAFRDGLPRGRPSKMEQRRAADHVIAQVERKLSKRCVNGTRVGPRSTRTRPIRASKTRYPRRFWRCFRRCWRKRYRRRRPWRARRRR